MRIEPRRLRLSPLAEQDLADIWTYGFRTWSRDRANRYHADIFSAIDGLASGERKGREADIREAYLKYAVRLHVLFYRLTPDHIDIIRILHQRMDVAAHL